MMRTPATNHSCATEEMHELNGQGESGKQGADAGLFTEQQARPGPAIGNFFLFIEKPEWARGVGTLIPIRWQILGASRSLIMRDAL